MKKLFSLALAAAMVISMGATAFASAQITTTVKDSDIVLSYFEKYESDTDEILDVNTPGNHAEYGNKYYAIIFEGIGELEEGQYESDDHSIHVVYNDSMIYSPISDFDRIEKLKMKIKFEIGEELVKSVNIVKKKYEQSFGSDIAADLTALPTIEGVSDISTISSLPFAGGWTDTGSSHTIAGTPTDHIFYYGSRALVDVTSGWYYFVEIETYPQTAIGDGDIIGTFTFNRKSNTKKGIGKIDDVERDFFLNLWYENNYNDFRTELYDIDDSVELKWDDLYVLKFNCDDEVEVEFGTEPNEGTFTVDVSGQGKMVINFSTEPDEAIIAANDGVKMDFVSFNGAKFNRVGEFEYEMEGLVAAYQVFDGRLVEISGLEISGDTATFHTAKLGNYVFANAELVNPA